MSFFFIAGFDFGTSYSKVVLREQNTGLAKAVTYGPDASGLFPSFVRIGKNVVVGPETISLALMLTYPKLIAADAAESREDFTGLYEAKLSDVFSLLETDSLHVVARLALTRLFLSVLNAVQKFISQDRDWHAFNKSTDPLVVQIAVPTGFSNGNRRTDLFFQKALAVAMKLWIGQKRSTGKSSVTTINQAWTEVDSLSTVEREHLNARCITYPEVAAGVQTVLRSPNTPEGKYITMDVGAGTVDMNVFYRPARDDDRRLDYWSCAVEPLGSAHLRHERVTWDRAAHETTVNPISEVDLEQRLEGAVRLLMKNAFRYQPNNIRGGVRPFMMNTHAYIWGGGAECRIYREILVRTLKFEHVGVETVNYLPSPSDQFIIPRDVNFGRLAVAYGLSYHKANLETLRLPDQLATFEELYPDYWRDVLGGQQLCNCRANPDCVRCYGTGFIEIGNDLAPRLVIRSQDIAESANIRNPAQRIPSRFDQAMRVWIHKFRTSRDLIDQYHSLVQIRRLYITPRQTLSANVLRDATQLLSSDASLLSGTITIRRGTARRFQGGCSCLTNYSNRWAIRIYTSEASYLFDQIAHAQQSQLNLRCKIRRQENGEFYLTPCW